MTETATAAPADKTTIRGGLEQTLSAYRELISQIPEDKWGVKSGNGAFTCGQLAWHIASGLDFSAGIIAAARKGKQTSVPSFLMPIGYKLNEFRIRSRSKSATRESVLVDYDRDHARLMGLLDEVTDDELAIVKTNYGMTQSVREMFQVPVDHLAEHAPEIRSSL